MDKEQIFEVWEPAPGSMVKLIVEQLVDDNDGLTLFLRDPGQKAVLSMRFDAHAAYRNLDESYRSRTFTESGGFQFSLYKIRNSKWLNWFLEESLQYYEDVEFIHYAIFTAADCIDVISEFPPEVFWVDH